MIQKMWLYLKSLHKMLN